MDYPYESASFATDMFTNGQQEFKYDMMRSISQNSMQQSHGDIAPSLLSSNSAASPSSSSTAGSPYSSHAQPVSTQAMYPNHYITVCDDSYPYGYETAHYDNDAAIGQDAKLTAPFVGKCADLSSFAQRSTAMPVQECIPPAPLVSSPKPIATPSESASSPPSTKRHRSSDDAAQVTAKVSKPKSSHTGSNTVFKSPTTPASAYPKSSSPNARRTTLPSQVELSHSSFPFSYSHPSVPIPSMSQHGGQSQYNFFSQTNGNFIPPIEASCLSLSYCLCLSLSDLLCQPRAKLLGQMLTYDYRSSLALRSTVTLPVGFLWILPSSRPVHTLLTSSVASAFIAQLPLFQPTSNH